MNTISRRTFLGASTLALAACATSKGGAPAVRFGVRTPTAARDLGNRAAVLRTLGYDGIELGPELLNEPVEAIREKVGDFPVSAIVGSLKLLSPVPAEREAAIELDRKRIAMARALGAAGVIEVPAFGPCKFPEAAALPAPHEVEDRLLAEALRQLAPDVAREGIPILLEPLTKKETHYMNLQSHGC
jgi:sugar phosphate isomerase/epimerase